MRERDVGLFSLIQQVISNIPWALGERRTPIACFGENCCYWTPNGYLGKDTVWEYYFEPVIAGCGVATLADEIRVALAHSFPNQSQLGYFLDEETFVSNHYGDHPSLAGKALSLPYMTADPDDSLRRRASRIIQEHIHPRCFIREKERRFFEAHMRGRDVLGVHVRGTDAVSPAETRTYRRGSLDLGKYARCLERLLGGRPNAKIFVATDAESSLQYLREVYGDRIIAYDAIRHRRGEAAGKGPTGCIMPAYVSKDRQRAAQNGADAVVEYLLLARCSHLVHNGASLAMTVLLKEPTMPHTPTHRDG